MGVEMLTALGAFFLGVAAIMSAILLNRKTQVLLEYRLGEVEKKLDQQNIAEMKTDIAVIKTKVESIAKEA